MGYLIRRLHAALMGWRVCIVWRCGRERVGLSRFCRGHTDAVLRTTHKPADDDLLVRWLSTVRVGKDGIVGHLAHTCDEACWCKSSAGSNSHD